MRSLLGKGLSRGRRDDGMSLLNSRSRFVTIQGLSFVL